MLLSIITPTYNRAHCLPNLYKSLLQNDDQDDFEWIIVDDGSIDETSVIVNNWIQEQNINIKYIKKLNEGKTNALVDGFNSPLKGLFSVVIDSDDILVKNAVHVIKQNILDLASDEIGLTVLKSDLKGSLIGSKFYQKSNNYAQLYFGKERTSGDKLFIVKTDIYKNSLIKSFKGEKLIPESVFYLNMGRNGNFKCLNEILYCGDYLEDGLSFDVMKLVAFNIEGFIKEKRLLQEQNISILEKIKNEIKYISYSYSANKSSFHILSQSSNRLLSFLMLLPSFIFTFKRIKKIRGIRNEIK